MISPAAAGELTRASCQHWYAGRPRRGTAGLVFPVLLNFSSMFMALTRAVARSIVLAPVLQTVLFLSGPLVQSGNSCAAALWANTSKGRIEEIMVTSTQRPESQSSATRKKPKTSRGENDILPYLKHKRGSSLPGSFRRALPGTTSPDTLPPVLQSSAMGLARYPPHARPVGTFPSSLNGIHGIGGGDRQWIIARRSVYLGPGMDAGSAQEHRVSSGEKTTLARQRQLERVVYHIAILGKIRPCRSTRRTCRDHQLPHNDSDTRNMTGLSEKR